MKRIIVFFETKNLKWGAYIIGFPLVVTTVIELLNVFGRKFVVPFPCALEAVECLMVVTTYFGVSLLAAEGGHVNVIIMTRNWSPAKQNFLDSMGNLFGAFIFFIWTWGAWRVAIKAISILEIRIGVFRFPIWPFRTAFAIGLSLLTIQLVINSIKFMSAALGRPLYIGGEKKPPVEDMLGI